MQCSLFSVFNFQLIIQIAHFCADRWRGYSECWWQAPLRPACSPTRGLRCRPSPGAPHEKITSQTERRCLCHKVLPATGSRSLSCHLARGCRASFAATPSSLCAAAFRPEAVCAAAHAHGDRLSMAPSRRVKPKLFIQSCASC